MGKTAEDKLIAYLNDNDLDAMFVAKTENVRYISSYTGDDAFLILDSKGNRIFITDPRYTEQASEECPGYSLVEWRSEYGSVPKALVGVAKQEHYERIGYESDFIVVCFFFFIKFFF